MIAFGHALPCSLQDTFGVTSVGLTTEKSAIVGKMSVGYLFVRPLAGLDDAPQKMNVSYAKHWKKRITLEVGHRGMGNSYTKLAAARENTLHSLNSAAKKGADYVEFDVHLTKDKVPIVFHDFHVLVNVAKRSNDDVSSTQTSGVEEHELAVKDLKFSQLRLLHVSNKKNIHLAIVFLYRKNLHHIPI
jgi:glycerophosphocholine phosphodiesterase GPCPD1